MATEAPFKDIGMTSPREVLRECADLEIEVGRKEIIPIVAAATAQDFNKLVFPAGTEIRGFKLIVIAAEATGATKTVDVGISGGDENGFIDGLSVAATGHIKPTLADGAQTLGVLLSVDESGGDLVPEPYVCTAETTLCYTLGSNDFAELEAFLVARVVEPT